MRTSPATACKLSGATPATACKLSRVTPAGKANPSVARFSGVTFIEVLVVLFILATVSMVVIPTFQNLLEQNINWEANRLRGIIHLLRNEAVLTRNPQRLVFDLKTGEYWGESRSGAKGFQRRDDVQELKPHAFSSSVIIKDMVLYGDNKNRIVEKQVPINLDPSGFMDPFLLHLQIDKKDWTLRVKGFTGHVDLLEGYIDAEKVTP